MVIPVPTAELTGTLLETLVYGVYLVVLPRCVRDLRQKQVSGALLAYLLATAFVSFLLITMHWIVDLVRVFDAFTAHMYIPNAPEAFFANVDTSLNITKTAAYVAVTLLADALLLYRTFIVWGRSYLVCIAPLLLFFLDISMAVWFTGSINEATPGKSVLVSAVWQRCKYFYAATLAMNLLCTLLIAFKIWKMQHAIGSFHFMGPRKLNVLSIILESAAIYSASLICLIATSTSGNPAMFFFLNSMPPLMGTVFTYVIIRSSTDSKYPSSGTESSRDRNTFQARSGGNAAANDLHSCGTGHGGVVVHLDRVVHVQGDGESDAGIPRTDKDDQSIV